MNAQQPAGNESEQILLNLRHTIEQRKDTLELLDEVFEDGTNLSSTAEHWQLKIKRLRHQTLNKQAVIGVVGATGSGKSSLINAVLDEELLLPTSSMSACTSVAIEISWNESDDPQSCYSAKVELLTKEEWRSELEVLLQDLAADEPRADKKSALVAWKTLQAVYPTLTKADLPSQTAEKLARHPNVRGLLDKQIHIHTSDSRDFHDRISEYINSGQVQKLQHSLSTGSNALVLRSRNPQIWPLIKVVRLKVKSLAVSTGVVLVDLPGLQDSNAARAAVAEKYLERCDALWIVSPIQRAVSDKIASDLLGEQFKMQVQLDGRGSRITFVCSKTDEILLEETSQQLGLADEFREITDAIETLNAYLDQRKASLETLARGRDTTSQIPVSQSDVNRFTIGEDAQPVTDDSASRKRGAVDDDQYSDHSQAGPHKRQMTDADFMQIVPVTGGFEGQSLYAEDQRVEQERNASAAICELPYLDLQDLEKAIRDLETQRYELCIQARNIWIKQEIRHDFAATLAEMNQTAVNRTATDASSSQSPRVTRDYDHLITEFPVFCVSSTAYQKLKGRFRKDRSIDKFGNETLTEIPQLREYCKTLTDSARELSYRNWLNEFDMLIDSLTLWCGTASIAKDPSKEQSEQQRTILRGSLDSFEMDMHANTQRLLQKLSESFQASLSNHLKQAVRAGQKAALDTSAKWGGPPSKGGLYCNTYQATTRRKGIFKANDFNQDLTKPMLQSILDGWTAMFHSQMPTMLETYEVNATSVLDKFRRGLKEHKKASFIHKKTYNLLERQNRRYLVEIRKIADNTERRIETVRVSANRAFKPEIQDHMLKIYDACAREQG